MKDRESELMTILQEEASEVTQAISKIFRFGPSGFNPKDRKKVTNIHHLEDEIGDILGVLKLLIEEGYVDGERIQKGAEAKVKKLDKFMTNPPE
jgi:NTP pyrophosphatase (non-canonical NTP hydrolase)